MYKACQFGVLTETVHGEFHRSRFFETEKEARCYANKEYSKENTVTVEIFKTGFYKKRRNSVVIASATKR
jgi:hypothetical protein